MNNHPPPPLLHRPTTTQILKQTTAVFTTRHHFLLFLLLSFFLLSFRVETETITHSLTKFIHNDPSIKSLFPPKPTTQNHHHQFTKDVQFFNENDENSFTTKPESNSTPILLDSVNTQLGFCNAKLTKHSASNVTRNAEIEHQDSSALYAYLAFCGSYASIVLVYVLSQSLVNGIIFAFVVNHFLNNHNPFMETFRRGTILGTDRLVFPIMIRWAIRDLLAQVLSVWFFGQIEEGYSFFKIFLRSRFMSLSISIPLVKGFEIETLGFLLSYYSLDMLISFVFALGVWVVMANSRKTCGEVFREGCYTLSLAIIPAINLKILEDFVTGSFPRFRLSRVFGGFLASLIQFLMVIYFMVAWMVYYLSVKSMDANSRGVPFGQTEFQALLNEDDI